MIGTTWTSPGNGATGKELRAAIPSIESRDALAAWAHLTRLLDHPTNLALTGHPVVPYDLIRMKNAT